MLKDEIKKGVKNSSTPMTGVEVIKR